MPYIHELEDWPQFTWDEARLAAPLADVRHRQGRLLGRMEALGFDSRRQAVLRTLTEDVVKTSEIEGENLDAQQVRSSIGRRLGIDVGALPPTDRRVEGVVEMMLDATGRSEAPVTRERIWDWHAALFPTGRSGMRPVRTGAWRDDATGPMQVVSGAIGHERVHFEAPAAERLEQETAAFLDWFNRPAEIDPVLKAATAHLWFVTIHPLDDGNGRVARALTDLALTRSEGGAERFYSLSAQIQQNRSAYYQVLERTQKGRLDVTAWMGWFLQTMSGALDGAADTLSSVLRKARFWEAIGTARLNARQRLMLNRLLDGFRGKLTTSKWAQIAKCSQDSALRDISDLIERGVLERGESGGRSTSYRLVAEPPQPRT